MRDDAHFPCNQNTFALFSAPRRLRRSSVTMMQGTLSREPIRLHKTYDCGTYAPPIRDQQVCLIKASKCLLDFTKDVMGF